jgi:hypothetical protein
MLTPASNRAHTNSFPASTTARSSHILPDLQDRGACARFRLRKKTRNHRSFPCIPPVDQLRTSVLNLHRKVDQLGEALLRQAHNLQSTMQAVHATQTMLVAFLSKWPSVPVVLPPPILSMDSTSNEGVPSSSRPSPHHSVPDSRDDDCLSSTLPTVSETAPVSAPVSIIANLPASSFSSSPHHGDVTEAAPVLTVSGPSLASTLPGLRGRFLKHSGRKNQPPARTS